MKKFAVGIVAVLVLAVMYGISVNNTIIAHQQDAEQKLANVASALQRRADLLPNLASIVARYATHEQSTFIETARARASAAASIKLDAETLSDPEKLRKFQAAQGEVSSFLSRLMAVQEQYPNLKADRLFIDLQAQVEGTENRIKVERDNYNTAVRNYNNIVLMFPSSLVASFRNFQKLPYFQAEEAAAKTPDLGDLLK